MEYGRHTKNLTSVDVKHAGKGALTLSDNRAETIQKKNTTGLPDNLKSGVENLSGLSMDDVKVHYNSDKPAQLNSHAYAQGTDIHIASGQEKHLAHEAWHVVQQKQGRVKPTTQMKGKVNVNDDVGLEKEADMMGMKALQNGGEFNIIKPVQRMQFAFPVVQRLLNGDEEQGDKIKIWDDEDGVREVYFVKTQGDEVIYAETSVEAMEKGSKKRHKKIHKKFAFPVHFRDRQIEAEIALEEQAEDDLESSSMGSLNISKKIIEYVTKRLEGNEEIGELGIQLTEGRIKGALAGNANLASQFMRGHESTFEEFKELFESDEEYYTQEIVDSLRGTGTRSDAGASSAAAASGGKGNEDWKKGKTEDLKKELLSALSPKKLEPLRMDTESTLHHKMSRSHFKKLMALLKQCAPSVPGVAEMHHFIGEICKVTRIGDPEDALENWTANIELGVLANHRAEGDDPGEEFDGNFLGGAATPRTECLQEVDLIIGAAPNGNSVDWERVYQLLEETRGRHVALNKHHGRPEHAFSIPRLDQWRLTGHGFVRDKAGASAVMGGSGSGASAVMSASAAVGSGAASMREFVMMGAGLMSVASRSSVAATTTSSSNVTAASGGVGHSQEHILVRQLDFVRGFDEVYAVNDPRIRDMGQCFWDTLRQHGIGDEALAAAALAVGVTVDQHLFLDKAWAVIQEINRTAQTPFGLVIDMFNILTGEPIRQMKEGNLSNAIRIGFVYNPADSNGHFVPPYRK